MSTYVINLPHRTDRREAFSVPASWPFGTPQFVDGVVAETPEIGCALAHLQVLETALTSPDEWVAVLEDDVCWAEGAEGWLADWPVPNDADVVLLGGEPHWTPTPVGYRIARVGDTARTHAYVLRPHVIPSFLAAGDELHKHRWHFDSAWAPVLNRLKTYMAWPQIAGQSAGLSDMTGLVEPARLWEA
jgi:hypothetical protein